MTSKALCGGGLSDAILRCGVNFPMLARQMTTYSFEFFPARTESGFAQLMATAKTLAQLQPEFMTVTYGAGGSTRDGTLHTAASMQAQTGRPVASHLTFCATKKPDLDSYIAELRARHITRVIALRGDLPEGHSFAEYEGDDYYQRTSDFVADLKQTHGLDISVAAYPEKHPMAPSMADDIEALRLKCEAGADRAITQFCFDHDAYDRFMDETAKAGITCPIVPGVMAIADFAKLQSFAGKCGAGIPQALRDRFARVQETDHEALASDVLAEQIAHFRMRGAPHIHIYTMNKAGVTQHAIAAQNETHTTQHMRI